MCEFVSETQLILKRFTEPFESTNVSRRVCKFVGKTQLILKRFTEPFESRKRTMLRRYDYLYELDSSEVEVDDLPMGQGETEGREGALGYRTRRMRGKPTKWYSKFELLSVWLYSSDLRQRKVEGYGIGINQWVTN